MSTDYSKKKNAELEELLKARSLPHSGKKADLIARLQQYDKEHSSSPQPVTSKSASSSKVTVPDDEIDWDDDAAGLESTSMTRASTAIGAAAIAAGGQGHVANPAAVPNQAVDTDPSTTSDLTVTGNKSKPNEPKAITTSESAPAAEEPTTTTTASETTPASAIEYSSLLPTSTLESELAKRKARAARFGLQESDEQALKALERAKRFGTGDKEEATAVKGLNEALPERRKRGRGRGEDGEGQGGEERKGERDGSKRRRDGGRKDGGRRRGGSVGGKGGEGTKNGTADGKKGGGGGSTLSEKDKAAAEARKKRFAGTV